MHLVGKDAARDPSARRSIGGLIDAPALYPNLSGWENLRVYAHAHRVSASRMGEVLELVGLTQAARRLAGTYSLGMRQRLGIALALLHDPEVLVLDEPQNGLDPGAMREMRTLLKALQARGHTLLVSSHLLHEVEKLASHVALIAQGRTVFEGTVAALRARAQPALLVEVDNLPQALEALQPQLRDWQQEGAVLTLHTDAPAGDVARTLVEAGLELRRLEPHLTLEGLFFELSGTRQGGLA